MSWDEDGQPHGFSLRRSGRSEQEPDRLPEVRELRKLGWELAPDAPSWAFLPYVWPQGARTWIRDRSTRWVVETCMDALLAITDVRCEPMTEEELRVITADEGTLLADAGVPAPPAGRLWLLRPVGPFGDLAGLLDHLCARADGEGVDLSLSRSLVALCAKELAALAQGPARD
ncbi:hypothetical protein J7F03_04195 [Streptomyces sp. ISL-43]|uniref:DUF5956 family protein n=1 Tax=Streptomyces sp. ISL-43 TaxID=2819183 RepID=UPI001BEB0D3A|nr:DUF5956 family protein [Streptomyces sp. ISL-43]MBT2446295.1 hypothetical protein [Streptomyces sp. ISL-43]